MEELERRRKVWRYLVMANMLTDDAVSRTDVAGELMAYGNDKGDGLTRTQVARTIDEARRLLLAAKKELG